MRKHTWLDLKFLLCGGAELYRGCSQSPVTLFSYLIISLIAYHASSALWCSDRLKVTWHEVFYVWTRWWSGSGDCRALKLWGDVQNVVNAVDTVIDTTWCDDCTSVWVLVFAARVCVCVHVLPKPPWGSSVCTHQSPKGNHISCQRGNSETIGHSYPSFLIYFEHITSCTSACIHSFCSCFSWMAKRHQYRIAYCVVAGTDRVKYKWIIFCTISRQAVCTAGSFTASFPAKDKSMT